MELFTPREYLKIDIANNFGLDKENWSDRIKWFDDNEARLEELLHQAEEPALFYAGVQAWRDVCAGRPTGYLISLDATSSGLQILTVLTGDHIAAKLCNVVDTGKREDAYTNIFEVMVDHLINRLGQHGGGISRDDCKRAIMTSLYGSRAVPKEVFGEGIQLKIFYQVMEEITPAVWELNEAFLEMWDPKAYSHDWVLPDNYHVHVKVMNTVKETIQFMNQPVDTFHTVNEPMPEGLSLGANVTHSLDGFIVRELTRRCDYNPDTILKVIGALNSEKQGSNTSSVDDKMVLKLWTHYQQSGYLSARILDHLDTGNIGNVDQDKIWELINSLPEKPFKIVSTHDCFRILPTYGNDLRIQYNRQLAMISESNMLEYLLSQILGRQILIEKLDPNLHKKIMQANYALS